MLYNQHLMIDDAYQMLFAASYQKDIKILATDIKGPTPSGYNLDHQGHYLCDQYSGTPPITSVITMECE